MPHQVHQRTFGRPSAHRKAMLRNLTLSVLRYERVKTTEAKAKEVRRLVDRIIGLGKDGSLAARRRATSFLFETEIVEKVFADLPARYPDRNSGYTRITHLGRRVGDSAPVMLIELMPGVDETKAADDAAEEVAKPRRRLRIPRRAAAKADDEAEATAKPAPKRGGRGGAPATEKKKATTKKAKS